MENLEKVKQRTGSLKGSKKQFLAQYLMKDSRSRYQKVYRIFLFDDVGFSGLDSVNPNSYNYIRFK